MADSQADTVQMFSAEQQKQFREQGGVILPLPA